MKKQEEKEKMYAPSIFALLEETIMNHDQPPIRSAKFLVCTLLCIHQKKFLE